MGHVNSLGEPCYYAVEATSPAGVVKRFAWYPSRELADARVYALSQAFPRNEYRVIDESMGNA